MSLFERMLRRFGYVKESFDEAESAAAERSSVDALEIHQLIEKEDDFLFSGVPERADRDAVRRDFPLAAPPPTGEFEVLPPAEMPLGRAEVVDDDAILAALNRALTESPAPRYAPLASGCDFSERPDPADRAEGGGDARDPGADPPSGDEWEADLARARVRERPAVVSADRAAAPADREAPLAPRPCEPARVTKHTAPLFGQLARQPSARAHTSPRPHASVQRPPRATAPRIRQLTSPRVPAGPPARNHVAAARPGGGHGRQITVRPAPGPAVRQPDTRSRRQVTVRPAPEPAVRQSDTRSRRQVTVRPAPEPAVRQSDTRSRRQVTVRPAPGPGVRQPDTTTRRPAGPPTSRGREAAARALALARPRGPGWRRS